MKKIQTVCLILISQASNASNNEMKDTEGFNMKGLKWGMTPAEIQTIVNRPNVGTLFPDSGRTCRRALDSVGMRAQIGKYVPPEWSWTYAGIENWTAKCIHYPSIYRLDDWANEFAKNLSEQINEQHQGLKQLKGTAYYKNHPFGTFEKYPSHFHTIESLLDVFKVRFGEFRKDVLDKSWVNYSASISGANIEIWHRDTKMEIWITDPRYTEVINRVEAEIHKEQLEQQKNELSPQQEYLEKSKSDF